jgi:hypothetical protein
MSKVKSPAEAFAESNDPPFRVTCDVHNMLNDFLEKGATCRSGVSRMDQHPDSRVIIVNDYFVAPDGQEPDRTTIFNVRGQKDSILSVSIAASRELSLEELIGKLRSIWGTPKGQSSDAHSDMEKG